MIADVASLNARVGGRKSELLPPSVMESVLAAESLPAVFSVLHATVYGPDLDRATLRHRGVEAIEKAIGGCLARSCRSLLRAAPEALRPVVAALLSDWDLRNLLAVLRALHGGTSPEEAQATFVPAGELDDPALGELLSCRGVPEACSLLVTWGIPWADEVARAVPVFRRTGRLAVVEVAAVSAITGWALKAVAGPGIDRALAREAIGRRLDAAVILATLRYLNEGAPVPGAGRRRDRGRRREVVRRARRIERARRAAAGPGRVVLEALRREAALARGKAFVKAGMRVPRPPVFPEGGAVFSGKRLEDLLLCPDEPAFIRLLAGTFYGRALGREMVELQAITDPSVLERNLEELLLAHFGTGFAVSHPATIAPLISWLWRAWAEAVDLRITVRGKAAGMPREAIEAEWYHGA